MSWSMTSSRWWSAANTSARSLFCTVNRCSGQPVTSPAGVAAQHRVLVPEYQ
jgi:hypothetical protein